MKGLENEAFEVGRLYAIKKRQEKDEQCLNILAKGIKDETTLKVFLDLTLGIKIPKEAVCQGHQTPWAYLQDSILSSGIDKICWANRGGGKTMLGAISTWLDAMIIPGCQIKILGGSFEQSTRMYEYTTRFWENKILREKYLFKDPMVKTTRLRGGGSYTILTASQKSVRGPHVPRVKLDEIDEFDKDIYEAACFIAQSSRDTMASTELFSTMHKPYGLMAEIIDNISKTGYKLYKWCLFEVLEKCTQPRESCQRCALLDDCITDEYPQGKARKSDGYYSIEDAIKLKNKVSIDSWNAEALCLRPSRSGLVYVYWNEDIHVIDDFDMPLEWKRYRAIDFGVTNPFCCLYIAQSANDEFFVYDELYDTGKTALEWAKIIKRREIIKHHGRELEEQFEFTTADPSGKDQIMTFCQNGIPTLGCWNNDIEFGLEQVKQLLKIHSVRQTPSLKILAKCVNIRREFNTYHYPNRKTGDRNIDEKPVDKDNHAMSAIRYFAVDIARRQGDITDISREL